MRKLSLLACVGLIEAQERKWPTSPRKDSMVRSATSTGGSFTAPHKEGGQTQVFSSGFQVADTSEGEDTFAGDEDFGTPVQKKSGCKGAMEALTAVGGGAAYVFGIHVGYRRFTCILDTSSFDLSIIGRLPGKGFDRSKSRFHRRFPNPHSETADLIFGSGPARIRKAVDFVALIKKGKPSQTCRDHETPVGTIVRTNIAELHKDDEEREYDGICGMGIGPRDNLPHRLVSKMDIKRFGICLAKDITLGGIVYWNYNAKKQQEIGFKFSTCSVVGPYWAIALTNARAELGTESIGIACHDTPCLAIMDSSSSLHALDSGSLMKIHQIIGDRHLPCDESLLTLLPTFCYTDEHGNSLCLKPHDYVYKMSGDYSYEDIPAYIRESLAFTPQNLPNFLGRIGCRCVLLIGNSGEKNLHVLGIPWFKSYWVGFETGSSTVSWAMHDGGCRPASEEAEKESVMREIDPTKLQPPAVALRLTHAKKSGPKLYQQTREQIGFAQFDDDEL